MLTALLEALDSADIGCTITIVRGERVERAYANAAIARIFGVDATVMESLEPMAMLVPAERARLEALRRSGDRPVSLETAIARPDGRIVPVEVGMGYAPLGGERAVFVFMRDVTTQRESQEHFRLVSELSPDAITVTSKAGYLYANPVAMRRLGVKTADELARFDKWAGIPPGEAAVLERRTDRLFAGESIEPRVLHYRDADGRDRILEASHVLTSTRGEPALISYTRDVSERVRLQADSMKRDRFASLGVLAAGVSHELNNPLTSLSFDVQRLRQRADLPDDVHVALQRVEDAANAMQTVIADLLFMARPLDRPAAHVDVGKVIASSIGLVRAGGRCPDIELDIGPLPPVQAYASKLGQVFLNVLRNAVQALESTENPVVRVRARTVREGVEVVISDNGPGAAADVAARLMHPFVTTKTNGTGLGLWISRTLIAEHGGTLDIATKEGEGFTVTSWIPPLLPAEPASTNMP